MTELDLVAIRSQLSDCRLAQDLRYFPVVDSTNRILAELPPGEWTSGTIALADFQSAGRGRSGRSWFAPPGTSVMLSLLLERVKSIPPADYVMMFALAVRDAIAQTTGLDVQMKWPNDLLLNGRKVAGILGESSQQEGRDRVILGVGVNVDFSSVPAAELPPDATSLAAATGKSIPREDVIIGLIRAVDLWYRGLTHRPDDIFGAWAAALDTIGVSVTIRESSGIWNGIALGVQRDGGLLVKATDGGVRCVYAADVSVRHARGCTDL